MKRRKAAESKENCVHFDIYSVHGGWWVGEGLVVRVWTGVRSVTHVDVQACLDIDQVQELVKRMLYHTHTKQSSIFSYMHAQTHVHDDIMRDTWMWKRRQTGCKERIEVAHGKQKPRTERTSSNQKIDNTMQQHAIHSQSTMHHIHHLTACPHDAYLNQFHR
jgi:hypothetical protein